MPLYLSHYTGTAKHGHRSWRDAYRPIGSDQPGWSNYDLRADGGATKDGSGFKYSLLWLPEGTTPAPGLFKLGTHPDEPLSPRVHRLMRNLVMLREFVRARTLKDLVFSLVCDPPNHGWNFARQLWLGGPSGKKELWANLPAVAGGSVSDSFSGGDANPVAAPWTRDAGTDTFKVLTGVLTKVGGGGDTFYYYSNGGGWNADQTSQFKYASAITNNDWGPAVRIGSGGGGLAAYFYEQGPHSIYKYVAGTPTLIEVGAAPGTAVGSTYKISIVGSTISYFDDAVENTNSPASDAALTTAGNGAGVGMFNTGGGVDDFLATGEITAASSPMFRGS